MRLTPLMAALPAYLLILTVIGFAFYAWRLRRPHHYTAESVRQLLEIEEDDHAAN